MIEEDTWKDLAENYWGKEPALFKGSHRQGLFNSGQVLEILGAVRDRLNSGDPSTCKLYDKDNTCLSGSSHSTRSNSGLTQWLPDELEVSLDDYFSKLTSHKSYSNFTMFLDRPHEYHAGFWRIVRNLLLELYSHTSIPEQAVGTDMFIGNYKKTPFGVHKDQLHNLMFMAQGSRLMHFWPDAADQGQPDYTKSVSFQVNCGDMLYWPPGHWHVGEKHGPTSVSININFWEEDHGSWLEKAVSQSIKQIAEPVARLLYQSSKLNQEITSYPVARQAPNVGAELLSQLAKDTVDSINGTVLDLKLHNLWASRLSCAALDRPIPIITTPEFSREARYIIEAGSSVILIEAPNRLTLACNGHVHTKQMGKPWHDAVAFVNKGDEFTCLELVTLFPSIDQEELFDWLADLYKIGAIAMKE